MHLHLTSDERVLLLELLEDRCRDLTYEISHTDPYHFKQVLRTKEKVLEALLTKVAGELVADSSKRQQIR